MLWLVHYGLSCWGRMKKNEPIHWAPMRRICHKTSGLFPYARKRLLLASALPFVRSFYLHCRCRLRYCRSCCQCNSRSQHRTCVRMQIRSLFTAFLCYVDTIHTDTLVCTADLTWNFLRFLSSMMIGKRGSILLWNDMCYMNIFGRFCAYVSWFSSSTSSHALALENARTSTHIRSRLCRWAVTVDHFATTIIYDGGGEMPVHMWVLLGDRSLLLCHFLFSRDGR